MTPEFVDRIKSRFRTENQNLTPNRIITLRRMTAAADPVDMSDPVELVLHNLLPEVAEKLVSDMKKEKFKARITRLLSTRIPGTDETYTPSQLSKMDADCLTDDGRVKIERLNEILFEE